MTTLQEAAKLAIEALTYCEALNSSMIEQKRVALNALRAALAQQGEQAKPAAYITDTWQGPMVWTPEMYNDACTYCDDGEFPIPLYTVTLRPTSGDYAQGYAEGFNDACKPAPQAQEQACPECHCHFVGSDVTAPGSTRLVNTAPQAAQDVPETNFGNMQVQAVYALLCDPNEQPPEGEHWEGFMARRIVSVLRSAQPVAQPPLTDEQVDAIVVRSCKKDSSHLDAARVARAIEAAIRDVK